MQRVMPLRVLSKHRRNGVCGIVTSSAVLVTTVTPRHQAVMVSGCLHQKVIRHVGFFLTRTSRNKNFNETYEMGISETSRVE